jgi:hypothetical protein
MRNEPTAVRDFIRQNLIGRTVSAEPVSARTDDGQTETTYVDQTFFSNLVWRQNGFDFDLTAITIGRRYGLDSEGRRTALAGSMDAVRVFRYEMTGRVSTGKLLGFSRCISSTNEQFDPLAGACFMVQTGLQDDGLVITERQIGYSDFPAPGGGRKPQALDSRFRYVTDNRGGLTVELDQEIFDVDPTSFERRPSGDRVPMQLSREPVDREGEPIPS